MANFSDKTLSDYLIWLQTHDSTLPQFILYSLDHPAGCSEYLLCSSMQEATRSFQALRIQARKDKWQSKCLMQTVSKLPVRLLGCFALLFISQNMFTLVFTKWRTNPSWISWFLGYMQGIFLYMEYRNLPPETVVEFAFYPLKLINNLMSLPIFVCSSYKSDYSLESSQSPCSQFTNACYVQMYFRGARGSSGSQESISNTFFICCPGN